MKVERFDSRDSNVFKYVFDFGDAVAEAVLYRYGSFEKRTVICCSVMSGCSIGCKFCGSGNVFICNLSSNEIISQIKHIMSDQSINHKDVENFQIMFMSMGEPMLNFVNTDIAIRRLNTNYSNADLLLSTTCPKGGNYSRLFQLSRLIDKVGLQFSIHESTDEARSKLIPTNNRMNLVDIAKIGERWHQETGRKPFFNYCVHYQNNKIDNARQLSQIFDSKIWNCTVSVICEKDETVAQSIDRQEHLAQNFASVMLSCGYNTRVFNPAGQDDIGGGCGQLWKVQKWIEENANK